VAEAHLLHLSRELRDGPLQLLVRLRELGRDLITALLLLPHRLHLLYQHLLLVQQSKQLALGLRGVHLHLIHHSIKPGNLTHKETRLSLANYRKSKTHKLLHIFIF
jgi:hypothetical protein